MATIYKIEVGEFIYYGSTKKKLIHRQTNHNTKLKNNSTFPIYKKCRDLNIEKIKCIEIEKCKLEDRFIREGYYIRNCNKDILLNYQTAGRTKKEYQSIYSEKNKDKKKKYRENNKEKICEKASEIIICECGCSITKGNRTHHKKTNKHLNLINAPL